MANWKDVRNHLENNEPIPLIPEGTELYPVVGLSFVPGYPSNILALQDISDNAPVQLVRNPKNPYDSNAVEVRLGGMMLGHLAKEVAAVVAPNMDDGATYKASIYQIRVSPENPNNPGLDILLEKV